MSKVVKPNSKRRPSSKIPNQKIKNLKQKVPKSQVKVLKSHVDPEPNPLLSLPVVLSQKCKDLSTMKIPQIPVHRQDNRTHDKGKFLL